MATANQPVSVQFFKQLDRFISEREVLVAIGIKSRSTLRDMIAEGEFPKPICVSRIRVAWSTAEVVAWQAERITQRDVMLAAKKRKAG